MIHFNVTGLSYEMLKPWCVWVIKCWAVMCLSYEMLKLWCVWAVNVLKYVRYLNDSIHDLKCSISTNMEGEKREFWDVWLMRLFRLWEVADWQAPQLKWNASVCSNYWMLRACGCWCWRIKVKNFKNVFTVLALYYHERYLNFTAELFCPFPFFISCLSPLF